MRATLFFGGAMVALWGCSSDGTHPNVLTTGAGGNGGGTGQGAGSSLEDAATLEGDVRDTADIPLEGAVLGLCSSACYPAKTDAGGHFVYGGVPAGHYKLDVRSHPGAPRRYGVLSFPLDLAPSARQIIDAPLFLPETGDGVALMAGLQLVDVDADLRIEIDPATLELPFGVEQAYLAGVRVPLPHWPPNAMPAGTHAAWALNPYGTKAGAPMPIEVTNGFGLAPGQAVTFHTIDEMSGEVVLAAAGAVSADGTVVRTASGTGILRLTWLVLAP